MSIGHQLLYAARGLLREPEGGTPAAGLFRAYLDLPESERTEDGSASAAWYLKSIESGDFARRHANDLKKAELIAEVNALLGLAGLGKKKRTPAEIAKRRQRTRFRRELANDVAQLLREGATVRTMRARHGVSGFAIERAFGHIKRHYFRDPHMKTEDMRRLLLAEGKRQEAEERTGNPEGKAIAEKRAELAALQEQARRMLELARQEAPDVFSDIDIDDI